MYVLTFSMSTLRKIVDYDESKSEKYTRQTAQIEMYSNKTLYSQMSPVEKWIIAWHLDRHPPQTQRSVCVACYKQECSSAFQVASRKYHFSKTSF